MQNKDDWKIVDRYHYIRKDGFYQNEDNVIFPINSCVTRLDSLYQTVIKKLADVEEMYKTENVSNEILKTNIETK